MIYSNQLNLIKFFFLKNLLHDAQKLHNSIGEFKFAYDNYVSWEENGGKDLLLGANRLSTRQLFWLALARSRYRKQKAGGGITGSDYDRTFFWFKNQYDPLEKLASFREAFHCDVNFEIWWCEKY